MRNFRWLKLSILFLIFSEFVIPKTSYAGEGGSINAVCRPGEVQRRGGRITEKGPPGTKFIVLLTGVRGPRDILPGFMEMGVAGSDGTKIFYVPKGLRGVCDAKNITDIPGRRNPREVGGGGAQSVLSIESMYCDPNTVPHCVLYNIFDTIDFYLGANTSFSIPDLYADTNGDGEIDAGDVLYSLVDLNDYLANPIPNFSLGDTFTVVNGQVSQLPFMYFSTTEFDFDEATGFTTSTPYSGQATAFTQHDMEAEAIPEPTATLSFLALGILGTASILKRQLKPSKSTEKELTKVG